ncbi:MAG TPA: hypothetical protein VEQ16_08905 [Acidocella sp.]|jgi:hypothetical protein|nr:hypothetical protein [Acidocella sp.]
MRILAAFAFAALPGGAFAAPAFLPTQDVAVTYELNVPNRTPENYLLRYSAAGQMARVDPQAGGYFLLGNLPAGQAELIIPGMHAVVQAPDFSALTAQIYNADGAQFTPLGPGHYAGLDCEKYLVLDKNGTGTACLTPSGVVLHFAGHDARGSAEVTALSVTYAPQPADVFATPPGLTPLDLPPEAVQALLNQ